MDKKTALLSAILVLASGAIVGVCPQDEEGGDLQDNGELQEHQLDQPTQGRQPQNHHQHPLSQAGGERREEGQRHHHSTHHQRPNIAMTSHHQTSAATGMRRHYPRYDSAQQGYISDTRLTPYATNGIVPGNSAWVHPALPHDAARAAAVPIYGHAPVFYHPAPFPSRQYTTKVFRTHRGGSAVVPYEGASVRVPVTWGQRKAHSGTIRTSVWPAGTFSTYTGHYNPASHHQPPHPHHQRPPSPFQQPERGTAVTKKSGGRAHRTHLDNEVDSNSSEGINDESFCVRCPRKRVVLVAARGETRAPLKLPETYRRCPGQKTIRGGKKRRTLTRHGRRFRGAQGGEYSSEGNPTEENGDTIRLEALWGPSLGTLAQEGRHMTVFTLLHNNRAVKTCHVTMVVKVQRCNALLLPAKTRAQCSQGTAWGSRCEFQCVRKNSKTHYLPTDVKETTCEMMNVNGLMGWSHEPPTCLEDSLPASVEPAESDSDVIEEETCAMPFAPSDGTISCDNEDNSSESETVPVGTVCHYKCSPGFEIPPIQRHLATTKCLSGGDWSTAADPYCEKIVDDVQETMLPKSSITSRNNHIGK